MNPFLSIITVCLNAGDKLIQTIDTVLMQDYTDFEIVVKDGFSSDGSFERIPGNDKILKIQKKDSGIYDAMNQALECANGEYILFLNAGDFFYDNSVLESFYQAIIGNNFPGLVYCDYKTTGLGVYVENPSKLTQHFLFRTMLCHQVCMIKKEYYDKLKGFDTNFKVVADWDFLVRLYLNHGFEYKHIKMLGIVSTSGGFSYHNRSLAEIESKILRKQHFPDKYYLYNIYLLLTLPGFRKKVASGNGILSKTYQLLANAINR